MPNKVAVKYMFCISYVHETFVIVSDTKMQIPYSTDKDPKSFFQREEFSECILEAPRILQFDPES